MARKVAGALQRRRGQVLKEAIQTAVLAELAAAGYARLTMEGVAESACTGKASLYRRWISKEQLVLDTFHDVLPGPEVAPDTGDLRGDLVYLLASMAKVMASPAGMALLAVLRELPPGHTLVAAVNDRVLEPRHRLFNEALMRAVERGEIEPEAVTPLIAQAGPALLLQQHLLHGGMPSLEGIDAIVDELLLPALRCRSLPPRLT